jgi:threonylcarbamoyladenosine tRNA methylthiotransferase MtaB
VRSVPPEEIFTQVRQILARGAREIVLTGLQTASYGKDREGTDLSSLIKQIAGIKELERLRLGSLDPWAVNDAFVQAVSDFPALCGHFHLSLQSGCDQTLARMNRKYTVHMYAEAAERLRKAKPDTAITTDVMVGFPGETEEEFEQSLSFVKEVAFARLHVFVYSPRVGTEAAAMPGQVPAAVKKERGKRMRQLGEESENRFLQTQLNKTAEVLFEKHTARSGGYLEGYTQNYIKVKANGGKEWVNKVTDVRLASVENGFMRGTLL